MASMLDAIEIANLELIVLASEPGKTLSEFMNSREPVGNNVSQRSYKGTILARYDPDGPTNFPDVVNCVQDHINQQLENSKENSTTIL